VTSSLEPSTGNSLGAPMSMPWIFLVTSSLVAGYLVWLPGLYIMHMWRLLWHALYFVTSQKPPVKRKQKGARYSRNWGSFLEVRRGEVHTAWTGMWGNPCNGKKWAHSSYECEHTIKLSIMGLSDSAPTSAPSQIYPLGIFQMGWNPTPGEGFGFIVF